MTNNRKWAERLRAMFQPTEDSCPIWHRRIAILKIADELDAAGSSQLAPMLRDKLEEIADALDRGLGDTDATHLESNEEIREQYPVQWACSEVNKLLQGYAVSATDAAGSERNAVLGAWDDEAIGKMAGAALQSCPKLGYMSTAIKLVRVICKAQDELAFNAAEPNAAPQEQLSAAASLPVTPAVAAGQPAESAPSLHPVIQECIDNYGKYYADQHKLGMSVRSDMIYVAQIALRWADNAAAGSGGQSVATSDSHESPAAGHCQPAAPDAASWADNAFNEAGWELLRCAGPNPIHVNRCKEVATAVVEAYLASLRRQSAAPAKK